MTERSLKLAYFTHTFPVYTSTFIVEEIESMRSLGARICIYAVHKPNIETVPSGFRSYAAETTSIVPLSPTRFLACHLRAIYSHTKNYLSSLTFALQLGSALSVKDRFRTLMHWAQAPVLYYMLRSKDVDHVHVHFLNAPASIMLFVNKIYSMPYSVTAHGSDIFVERILQREKILAAKFTRVMTRFNFETLRSVAQVDSERPLQLVMIPLGVHLPETCCREPMPDIFTFLHVGRMVWQKDQMLLLEACAALRHKGYRFKLLLVGDGPLRETLIRRINDLCLNDTVQLYGALPKPEVINLYRRTHCFVLSSISEGSPAVLIEAMGEGQPVIAPALRGIPEMLTDGVEGWLFETGNVSALSEAMLKAIIYQNNLFGMGQSAHINARRKFDLDTNVAAFYSKLTDLR